LTTLYEDNHLLAVNKPAGVPTMGVAAGQTSVVTLARQYIKRKYRKPGNVYLGVVSRLDTGTSGVLMLARTSKAAARLTEQFRSRGAKKTYLAIVSGDVTPAEGTMTDWLLKDDRAQRMTIVAAGSPGAQEAKLSYRVLQNLQRGTLVEIDLQTGRKHQIRVQFAARGWPVWGETKYAAGAAFEPGLALHARRLVIEHPVRHEPVELLAPLPQSWKRLGVEAE
jgi:23S rRNA pseudouridine1911/1915/1917 synthase